MLFRRRHADTFRPWSNIFLPSWRYCWRNFKLGSPKLLNSWSFSYQSVASTLLKKLRKNALLSVNFVYAWKNYPTSTKLTLCGSPFHPWMENCFAFATVYLPIFFIAVAVLLRKTIEKNISSNLILRRIAAQLLSVSTACSRGLIPLIRKPSTTIFRL